MSWLSVLSLLLISGCSTTMTSMTEPHVYEPGEVQLAVNYQANAVTNVLRGSAIGVKSAAEEFGRDSEEPISEEALRNWLDTAILWSLFRPGTGIEILGRVGVTDNILEGLDVGFRTNLNVIKGDARAQLWSNEEQSQFLSVMLGYGYHLDVVNKVVEYITLTEFSRHDFDLQLIYGWEVGEWMRFALVPHLLLTRVSADPKLPDFVRERLPPEVQQYDPSQYFESEWIVMAGMNTSIFLGYKYAFVALDFGYFYMRFRPTIIGEERNYDGGAVSLAGGLSFHYAFGGGDEDEASAAPSKP